MTKQYRILAIDIGGTGLKAALVDRAGELIGERVRTPTPYPCPPHVLIETLTTLCAALSGYQSIAIGFPGVVRDGRVLTAPHFDNPLWDNFPLAKALSAALGQHPAKLVNDAEMQGLAAIQGHGLELVLTLGTGAGTALFRDGELMPHLELAQHPIRGHKTYNDYIGDVARKKIGKRRWRKHVANTIEILHSLLHFDHLYIGGGNAERLDDLPKNVSTVSNDAGLQGGAALWKIDAKQPKAKPTRQGKSTHAAKPVGTASARPPHSA